MHPINGIRHHIPSFTALVALIVIAGAFFIYQERYGSVNYVSMGPFYAPGLEVPVPNHPVPQPATAPLHAIQPRITLGSADIIASSSNIFAYAHATLAVDGKIFIGMSDAAGNPFAPNQLVIFGDPADISHATIISLPITADIETMTYDHLYDKVYFMFSDNHALKVYSIDPHTYLMSLVMSTTSVDVGRRPAIVTDGEYIYGITNTDPSKVFKIGIHGGGLTVSDIGHIRFGHSAAIGIYGSSTELYFGGGMDNGFEKVDAATLQPIAAETISPCSMSDDMPYVQTSSSTGYVYVGCETAPYGIRVNTSDMSYERFTLPGASLGLFSYGPDIYNASQDGYIDIFPKGDLTDLRRYKVAAKAYHLDTKGQDLQINEILYVPETGKLYLTAWYGVPGLYEVSIGPDKGQNTAAAIDALKPSGFVPQAIY